jgi:glutaminyl-tRNA synthetase
MLKGVNVSPEDISSSISEIIESKKQEIEEKRSSILGSLLGSIRKTNLRWANAADVKKEFDKQILTLLGPKDERDDPKSKV